MRIDQGPIGIGIGASWQGDIGAGAATDILQDEGDATGEQTRAAEQALQICRTLVWSGLQPNGIGGLENTCAARARECIGIGQNSSRDEPWNLSVDRWILEFWASTETRLLTRFMTPGWVSSDIERPPDSLISDDTTLATPPLQTTDPTAHAAWLIELRTMLRVAFTPLIAPAQAGPMPKSSGLMRASATWLRLRVALALA